jgi:hypothetical protein
MLMTEEKPKAKRGRPKKEEQVRKCECGHPLMRAFSTFTSFDICRNCGNSSQVSGEMQDDIKVFYGHGPSAETYTECENHAEQE